MHSSIHHHTFPFIAASAFCFYESNDLLKLIKQQQTQFPTYSGIGGALESRENIIIAEHSFLLISLSQEPPGKKTNREIDIVEVCVDFNHCPNVITCNSH